MRMKKAFFRGKYVAIFILASLVIAGILLYLDMPTDLFMMNPMPYAVGSLLLTLIIAGLFGANVSLLFYKYDAQRRFGLAESASSLGGAGISSLGAGCPVCGSLVLSLLGIGVGLQALPLRGLEFKLIGVALSGAALYWNKKQLASCRLPRKR